MVTVVHDTSSWIDLPSYKISKAAVKPTSKDKSYSSSTNFLLKKKESLNWPWGQSSRSKVTIHGSNTTFWAELPLYHISIAYIKRQKCYNQNRSVTDGSTDRLIPKGHLLLFFGGSMIRFCLFWMTDRTNSLSPYFFHQFELLIYDVLSIKWYFKSIFQILPLYFNYQYKV